MANKSIWTRNYWNLFSALFGSYNGSRGTTETPTHAIPYVKNYLGKYWKIYTPSSYSNAGMGMLANAVSVVGLGATEYQSFLRTGDYAESTYSRCNFMVGTGTGELNENNHTLFSLVTSGFKITNTSYSWSYDETTHTYTRVIKCALSYLNSTPINITEFGVFACAPTGPYNSDRCYYEPVLLYHELFDEAYNLQQNDTIELTLKQSIVQPHYSEYPPTS